MGDPKNDREPATSWNLATATREDFEPYLGSKFVFLNADQAPVELKLLESIDEHRGSEEVQDFRRPFSLVFEAENETVFEQALREIQHPELGQLLLFLIPIGVFEGKARYNSTFN